MLECVRKANSVNERKQRDQRGIKGGNSSQNDTSAANLNLGGDKVYVEQENDGKDKFGDSLDDSARQTNDSQRQRIIPLHAPLLMSHFPLLGEN